MIVVDTNLLIYAHRAQVPQHSPARQAIEDASHNQSGWGIAATSVAEFWSVVTHPSSVGRPSRPDEARAFLQALVKAGAQLLSPAPGFAERVIRTAEDLGIIGPRIFDLQIALIARDHGATEIWTADRGFVTVAGLRRTHPI